MNAQKNTEAIAAREVARNALTGVTGAPGLRDMPPLALREVAERVTTQDPWWMSKRIHASVAAAAVALLGAFGVDWTEAQVVDYLGGAAAIAAVVLPLLSKHRDIRAPRA